MKSCTSKPLRFREKMRHRHTLRIVVSKSISQEIVILELPDSDRRIPERRHPTVDIRLQERRCCLTRNIRCSIRMLQPKATILFRNPISLSRNLIADFRHPASVIQQKNPGFPGLSSLTNKHLLLKTTIVQGKSIFTRLPLTFREIGELH